MWCLAPAAFALAYTPPLEAQSPLDIFGTHSGGSRRPAVANENWLSLTVLLLTEFDGRFEDPTMEVPSGTDPVLLRHDNLQTSAGYNYLTYGGNRIVDRNAETWIPLMPHNTALTVAASGHVGFTKDTLFLAQSQTALHDFRGVTHNYRPNLEDNYYLVGGDVEALLWPETSWFAFGGHFSWGTYHRERGLTVILSDRVGRTKSHLAYTKGWLWTGVGPARVASALDDAYWSLRGGIEYTDRYGLSAGYSSGVFPDEREFLLSFFVAVQLSNTRWLRVEFVNDLLGGKDRGLTGGARIAYTF